MSISPWWKRLPSRLLEEHAALLELTRTEPFVRRYRWTRGENDEPRVVVELDLPGDRQEFEVRFPPHYPEQCPSVRPIPYRHLSSHQFGRTGVLCLELGPDNWHPRYHVSDMVKSAWMLLAKELINTVTPIEIPSRHVSDLAEYVRLAHCVFVRPSGLDAAILSAPERGDMDLALEFDGAIQVWPVSLPKGTEVAGVPASLATKGYFPGRFLRLRPSAPSEAPADPTAFAAFVAEFAGEALIEGKPSYLVLIWPDGTSRFYWQTKDKVRCATDVSFERDPGPRIPAQVRELLGSRRVGVVGLGSMGSKVVELLARTGVRRFVFVDGDLLLGPNLCRHTASPQDVGKLKVHAMERRLQEICLEAPEIVTHTHRLAEATNPDLHARILGDLSKVDVLVDATADPEAFCVLAMVSSDHQIPLVWGEVFGGGLGGFVASAHPKQTPCPHCVRAGFLAQTGSFPPAPSSKPDVPYAGGEAEPTVATDADVTYIAAAVASRTLDVLVDVAPQDAPVVLLGQRRGWIFERPFHSVPIDVRSDDWSCSLCWTPPKESDLEATAEIGALFTDTSYDKDSPVI
jgi:sulfur-carrier protein adenylyltransferase/sulfurtransferase